MRLGSSCWAAYLTRHQTVLWGSQPRPLMSHDRIKASLKSPTVMAQLRLIPSAGHPVRQLRACPRHQTPPRLRLLCKPALLQAISSPAWEAACLDPQKAQSSDQMQPAELVPGATHPAKQVRRQPAQGTCRARMQPSRPNQQVILGQRQLLTRLIPLARPTLPLLQLAAAWPYISRDRTAQTRQRTQRSQQPLHTLCRFPRSPQRSPPPLHRSPCASSQRSATQQQLHLRQGRVQRTVGRKRPSWPS